MAYKFKLKESLRNGVRRIAVEQLTKAIDAPALADARATWVHETRKSLKRIRALLRLVRSGLAAEDWRRENADLRDIARLLSPLRDRDVARAVLLGRDLGDDAQTRKATAWLAAQLEAAHAGSKAAPARDPEDVVAQAVNRLKEARKRLDGIAVEGSLAQIAGAGLAMVQRKGREALALAEADPSEGNFHELRKAVQMAWRQAALLEPAWPEMQAVRVAAARAISQQLGEVQDLAIVGHAAETIEAEDDVSRRHLRHVHKACRRRQDEIAAKALPAARRLFAEPPKAMARTMAERWAAAAAMPPLQPQSAVPQREAGPQRAVAASHPRPMRPKRSAKSAPAGKSRLVKG
jgi:CHAD domain-containing protein